MCSKRNYQKLWILLIFLTTIARVCSEITPTVSSEDVSEDASFIAYFGHESCQTETLTDFTFEHFYSVKPFVNTYGVIEILVKFKGISDGHVILTETSEEKEPLYLIVLGSDENKLSEIRRSVWGEYEFKMNTPGILSPHQFRGFIIRYNNKTGHLWVYSEGSDMPLLHWNDPEPLYIEYFSFAAYHDVEVQVAFNCKPTDEHSIISPFKPGIGLAAIKLLPPAFNQRLSRKRGNRKRGSHSC